MQKIIIQKIFAYAQLMRWHKPIGIFLLLWPTLWALWAAAQGLPATNMLVIFISGVIVMRSAGCVINDIADRHFDGAVARTKNRPLVTGVVSVYEAVVLFLILGIIALYLALQLNMFSIVLAIGGAGLTILYPFTKRITHFPQLLLGICFGGWPVLIVFAALHNSISPTAWLMFCVASCWPFMYDTLYAMVDREDDIKIGIKSTALWFGQYDQMLVGLMQMSILSGLILVGYQLGLGWIYYATVMLAGTLFGYQQYLISAPKRENYFKAFLNNNWFGMLVFLGFLLGFLTKVNS